MEEKEQWRGRKRRRSEGKKSEVEGDTLEEERIDGEEEEEEEEEEEARGERRGRRRMTKLSRRGARDRGRRAAMQTRWL